jgi:Protein of unknown function (DUF2924)
MTDRLRREIDGLNDLTRQELVERWQKAHGCLPPKGIKRNLLLHSAAWHLQARKLGGIKGDAKRTLRQLVKSGSSASESDAPYSEQLGISGARPVRQLRDASALLRRLMKAGSGASRGDKPRVRELGTTGPKPVPHLVIIRYEGGISTFACDDRSNGKPCIPNDFSIRSEHVMTPVTIRVSPQ